MNKLSISLWNHLLSYSSDCELALFACTSGANKSLIIQFHKKIEELQLNAWKSILSSSPETIWQESEAPRDLSLNPTRFTYLAFSKFFSHNRKNQKQECFDFKPCRKVLYSSPNEKFSVLMDFKNLEYQIVDKKKFVLIDKIVIDSFGHFGTQFIFVSESSPGKLQLITDKGYLLLHTLKKPGESDQKESCEQRKFISCKPDDVFEDKEMTLDKVCKVKNCFYFKWKFPGSRLNTLVTCMQNINTPNKHELLRIDDENKYRISSDNNFFYLDVFSSKYITVYKGSKEWRTIFARTIGFVPYPDNYHLVKVGFIEYARYEKLCLSIWDIRKTEIQESEPTIVELPRQFPKEEQLSISTVIRDGLIFIIEHDNMDVFHIQTRTIIASLNLNKRTCLDIERTPGRIPTDLICIMDNKKQAKLENEDYCCIQFKPSENK